MKKQFLFNLLGGSLFLILLASCSKDSLVETADPSSTVVTSSTQKMSMGDVKVAGTVMGIINPGKVSMSIYLYSDVLTYGPFYSVPGSGAFKIPGIFPGDYKMMILDPGSTDDTQVAVSLEVSVKAYEVTDVGVIHL